ncbi:extracellular polysaccharide biosynthesis protein [Salmonella enterica subsp. enterica serovar Typhi]|nr:exopolysaccharide biosynthesis protein [Salmonella enterica subsp. enterica serovar Typhi]CHP88448.1 extracellular polysaccharide biosynthesis protein [Salmonella enterica subsp. enterica serovar Typhi]CWZ97902.1 extracellular polysaccharide biosynthesis protein [Salmonella enterica subsp. enterica serovar Typhi]CXB89444.1 extracellular polysaccharide biosynthesis protein [Salmonella enterica subsp. enterica serovar Typhi]
MFLSVVTVAFRNYEGVVKTWRSLRNLARDPGLSFEWIVVDGGSEDGKPSKVWRFRSMKVMENDKVVTQATQNDPRVTRVGNFLRRTSLDELPQFINVLTGGMSIVGPRPHAVAHNEQYRQLIEGYMLRHKMKPGITGWAQINGWRGETDTLEKMEKRVEFDLEYIREWSIWFDIKIVFLTIFKGFVNKAAY